MSLRRQLLLIGTTVAVLFGLFLGGLWVAAKVFDRAVDQNIDPACDPLSRYDCKADLGFVEGVTDLTFPAGTTLVFGGTNVWREWHLSAAVLLPPGAAPLTTGTVHTVQAQTSVTDEGVDSHGRRRYDIEQTRYFGTQWPQP